MSPLRTFSSPRRMGALALGLVTALAITGCIGKRRPQAEDDGKVAARPAAAAPSEAPAAAPTEAAPPAAVREVPPTPPTPAAPAGDPNHKMGEASRIPNYAVPASGPSKGAEDALVTIVEFNAFDCAACKTVPPLLEKILAKHGSDVRLVFRHAPEAGSPGEDLARAAAAADEAGVFWKLHDKLMAGGTMELRELMKLVGDLGGDSAKFVAALRAPTSATTVANDLAVLDKFRGEAKAPILFVNGRYLDGEITLEQIDALVAEEKAKAEAFMKENGVGRSAGLYEDMRKRGATGGNPWRGYSQVAGM